MIDNMFHKTVACKYIAYQNNQHPKFLVLNLHWHSQSSKCNVRSIRKKKLYTIWGFMMRLDMRVVFSESNIAFGIGSFSLLEEFCIWHLSILLSQSLKSVMYNMCRVKWKFTRTPSCMWTRCVLRCENPLLKTYWY